MYVERTQYFAKRGRARDVLEVRRRASTIRGEVGLPEGDIFVNEDAGEGPDVLWECAYPPFFLEEAPRLLRL